MKKMKTGGVVATFLIGLIAGWLMGCWAANSLLKKQQLKIDELTQKLLEQVTKPCQRKPSPLEPSSLSQGSFF